MKKILWSERIKRHPKALTFETYLREQDNPISSHPEARDPRIIPKRIPTIGCCSLYIKYCLFSHADYDKLRAKFAEKH